MEVKRRPTKAWATRWFKLGDSQQVLGPAGDQSDRQEPKACRACGSDMRDHGWTLSGQQVCPGDWIVEEGESLSVWTDSDFEEHFAGVEGPIRQIRAIKDLERAYTEIDWYPTRDHSIYDDPDSVDVTGETAGSEPDLLNVYSADGRYCAIASRYPSFEGWATDPVAAVRELAVRLKMPGKWARRNIGQE